MSWSLLGDGRGRRYASLLLITLATAGGCTPAGPSAHSAAQTSGPDRAPYSNSGDIQLNPEDPAAQLALAQRYEDGHGVPKRASAAAFHAYLATKQGMVAAERWLEARVENGQPQATYWLGVARQGRDETLLALGLERLRATAKAGDADAMFSLGTAYESGHGVRVDYTAARKVYERAAELGHPTAMCYLASMYAHGTGVARDDVTAFRWYFRAASEKDAQGQFNVGNFIEAGRAGRPDPANAQIYFRQAAEQGHRDAQFNLAQLYNDGVGVPVDKAEALKWYTRAAAQGDAEARSKAEQLKGLPSSAPSVVAGATAPKVAPGPQPPSAEEPVLTPEQQAYADRIHVSEYDGYFNDKALRGFFARKLGKPTLDHLAKGKQLIWVQSSSFKMESGRLYCLATIGLSERPPEGRSPRIPIVGYSGMNGQDVNGDQSPDGVRVCRVNALTTAVETMAKDTLDQHLENIDHTALAGKPAQGLRPDAGMALLFSTGIANQDPVFQSISADVRRAFDYRKLEWVVLANAFHLGNRGVCVGSVGVAARAPNGRNPHVPGSLWQHVIELSPESMQRDPDLQQCKQRAAAAALTRARATEWDETGLLSGYERTREEGVPLVKPARRPQLAANGAGKPAPQPFDLILGRSTLSDARTIWQREGGSITASGYGEAMPAAGDNNPDGIPNPRVELFDVKGLPIDRLSSARFGFFDGGLYFIEYKFEERSDFEKLLLQVTAKYGSPDHSPTGMNRTFEWQFGDVLLVLEDNFMGRDTMSFTHQSTRRAVSASHAALYAAHIKKKANSQRGF